MSSLKYVGKNPTINSHITNRLLVDNSFAEGISRASVDDSVDAAVADLARTDYVDAQDGNLSPSSYVSQQDALLLPNSQKGVANGYASLDSGAKIPTAQLPLMGKGKIRGPYGMTSRNAGYCTPASDGFTSDHYVKLGAWNLAAPGFTWRPLIFMTAIAASWQGTGANTGVAGGRADLECRVGGNYNSTICASGRGSNYIRGYQGITVTPTTDLTPQSGASFSGYGSTSAVNIGVFLFDYFGGTTAELAGEGGFIFSASLFLIEIGNTA